MTGVVIVAGHVPVPDHHDAAGRATTRRRGRPRAPRSARWTTTTRRGHDDDGRARRQRTVESTTTTIAPEITQSAAGEDDDDDNASGLLLAVGVLLLGGGRRRADPRLAPADLAPRQGTSSTVHGAWCVTALATLPRMRRGPCMLWLPITMRSAFLPAGHVEEDVGRMTDPGVGLGVHAVTGEGQNVVVQVALDVLVPLGLIVVADPVGPHQV